MEKILKKYDKIFKDVFGEYQCVSNVSNAFRLETEKCSTIAGVIKGDSIELVQKGTPYFRFINIYFADAQFVKVVTTVIDKRDFGFVVEIRNHYYWDLERKDLDSEFTPGLSTTATIDRYAVPEKEDTTILSLCDPDYLEANNGFHATYNFKITKFKNKLYVEMNGELIDIYDPSLSLIEVYDSFKREQPRLNTEHATKALIRVRENNKAEDCTVG